MRHAVVIIIAYLLGSIPFGYLIVRATQGADVRETGSGGTGATNVSRRAGKLAGVVTLLLDALKGAAAVFIASVVTAHPVGTISWTIAAAAVAVIIGHMFPVWLGFRGGKGVATGVGVFLLLAPIPLALAGFVFLLIVVSTRYVSLGSILAAALVPVFIGLRSFIVSRPQSLPLVVSTTAISLLIVFAHRENIQRLVEGTENKFK